MGIWKWGSAWALACVCLALWLPTQSVHAECDDTGLDDAVLGTLVGQVEAAQKILLDDAPCSVKDALDAAAEKYELPKELLYAAAWSRSRWQHWDDNDRITGPSSSPGLFRISKPVWQRKFDWTRLQADLMYHADAGAYILAEAYDLVKRRTGWTDDRLLRATYAVFLGGPRALNSPWEDTPLDGANHTFDSALLLRPWEPTLDEECAVKHLVLDDHPCTVKSLIDDLAVEYGVPAELAYAVAWTESNWTQWNRYDRTVISRGGDHGLMQINVAVHTSYNVRKIDWDLEYSVRAGMDILKYAYDYAIDVGYKGEENIFRAAYGVYNGGRRGSSRPWKKSDPRDANFHRHLKNKPWERGTRDCDALVEAPLQAP